MNNKFIRILLHLIYPTKCPVCGSFINCDEDFCESCKSEFECYDGEFCPEGADYFCAAFVYNDKIKPAVMLLKDGICGNSDFALGHSLSGAVIESGIYKNIDMIVPVPLHKSRLRKRGYNQSQLIAKQISYETGIPLFGNVIIKTRITADQKNLSSSERRKNLKSAFSVEKPDIIVGKRILIVDDVCTTGSTLSEISFLLKKYGASMVFCAASCKTP